MSVYLEVDGNPVPAADCSWLLVAPCGCVCGLTVADPRVDGPVVTPEQAMGNLLFAHMECWEWLRAGEQS